MSTIEKQQIQKQKPSNPGSNSESQKQAPKISYIPTALIEAAKKVSGGELIKVIASKTLKVKNFVKENKNPPKEAAKRKELAVEIREIRDNNRPGVIELKKQELEAINKAKKSMESENKSITEALNGGIIKDPIAGGVKYDFGLTQEIKDKESQVAQFTALEEKIKTLKTSEGVGIMAQLKSKLKELQNRNQIKGVKAEIKKLEAKFGKKITTEDLNGKKKTETIPTSSFRLQSEIRYGKLVTEKLENQQEQNNRRLEEDREYVEDVKVGDPKDLLEKYYTEKLQQLNESKN